MSTDYTELLQRAEQNLFPPADKSYRPKCPIANAPLLADLLSDG